MALDAEPVALDEFPADIRGDKGLPQHGRVTRKQAPSRSVTDVIVGGCIPTRSSVRAKYQESVICLNIIIVVLPIELKFIDMGPVVNRRFKREIINGLAIHRLTLNGLGFLILIRETRGVKIECTKSFARIPHARSQCPPIPSEPSGVART